MEDFLLPDDRPDLATPPKNLVPTGDGSPMSRSEMRGGGRSEILKLNNMIWSRAVSSNIASADKTLIRGGVTSAPPANEDLGYYADHADHPVASWSDFQLRGQKSLSVDIPETHVSFHVDGADMRDLLSGAKSSMVVRWSDQGTEGSLNIAPHNWWL